MISKVARAASALATRKISFDLDLIPLCSESVPLKKIVNWILTEGSVTFKPAQPWGFPTVLQVEPTSRCNLECKVCPVAGGLDRPAGNMDLRMFRRIVDELGDYLLLMMFWDWGEPFLNPDSCEMIRYARGAGIKVVCSTNGHVFADAGHARRVVESGLDVLVFSVDGVTQETYQRYRSKGKLDSVLAGIRNVVAEKRRLGSATPLVNLRFIAMRHNEHEIPKVEDLARSLGVDVITLRKFHAVPGTGREGAECGEAMAPGQSRFRLPAVEDDVGPVRVIHNPCKNLWNCPTVHWDGAVVSCFMDFNERHPLGHLATQSFRQIWRGEAYAGLRRAFRDGWKELPLCGVCGSGFEGGDIGRESNAEAIFLQTPARGGAH